MNSNLFENEKDGMVDSVVSLGLMSNESGSNSLCADHSDIEDQELEQEQNQFDYLDLKYKTEGFVFIDFVDSFYCCRSTGLTWDYLLYLDDNNHFRFEKCLSDYARYYCESIFGKIVHNIFDANNWLLFCEIYPKEYMLYIIHENYLRMSAIKKIEYQVPYEKLLFELFSLEIIPQIIKLSDFSRVKSVSWLDQRIESLGGEGYQWICGFNDHPYTNNDECKETFEEFHERMLATPDDLS
jgi:hypothetical protein